MWTKLTGFMRDFGTLAGPYWVSEDRWRALALGGVVAALTAAQVQLLVMLNQWYQEFYDALQNFDQSAFWRLILKFSWIAAVYIVARVYAFYWRQLLEIRWRRWLTQRYVGDWLTGQSYYRLPLHETGADNPDQRIAEDLKLFVGSTLDLVIDFGRQMGTLVSFGVILWGISGSWTVPGTSFVIPAYMFWAALLYAIGGTWLTHRVGRPLAKLNFSQQRFEADFRFGLVRVRENAEGIALYAGEADEARRLRDVFKSVYENWWALMRRRKKLGSLTAGYDQAATLFPFIVASPRYFAKEIQLGGLMQISNAFGRVQDGLSWFVGVYADLAAWKATVDRLITFRRALVQVRAEGARGGIALHANGSEAVALQDVTLALPNGATLLHDVDAKLERGERVLVSGPSGSGKSTLFRAIAGIWPFGAGRIERPDTAKCLFLPQKPYLPIGSLRGALSFPAAEGAFSDEVLRAKLEACRLGHLTARLDEVAHWEHQLSPGEQQRVAFVRALLHKPAWLFMDEASSALDSDMEGQLYALLERELPETTWVSIAHRAAIEKFHRRRLAISGDGRLESAPLAPAVPAPS